MGIVTNLTKKSTPRIPWIKIKKEILGQKYDLGIILAENSKMKKLNKDYRKKDSPRSETGQKTNVLSFLYSKKEGEIFLNINNNKNDLIFLYIHALLHLKGIKHGKEMAKKEKLYYNYYHGT